MTIQQHLNPRTDSSPVADGDVVAPTSMPPLWGPPLRGPVIPEVTDATLTSHLLVADAGVIGGLTVRAASVSGTMHQLGSVPRQDSYHLRAGGGIVAVAVCDGVGSARLAEYGAVTAARSATQVALDLFDTAFFTDFFFVDADPAPSGGAGCPIPPIDESNLYDLASTLVNRVSEALCDLARSHGADPEDVATTLVLAVCAPDLPGIPTVAVQVGDSTIRLLADDADRWIHAFPRGDSDSPVNLVDPLPLSRNIQTAELNFPSRGPLLLVTDGIDVPIDRSAAVSKGLAHRWVDAPEPAAFISDVQFIKVDAFDDRTVVALWPPQKLPSPEISR